MRSGIDAGRDLLLLGRARPQYPDGAEPALGIGRPGGLLDPAVRPHHGPANGSPWNRTAITVHGLKRDRLRERTARSANEHRIDLGGEPTNDEEPAGAYGIPEARSEQQNGGHQARSERGTHSGAGSDQSLVVEAY